jgi:dihydroorotase
MIRKAKKAGAVAGKVYPLGVTTNSDEGLRDFRSRNILKTFKAMEDVGMLLLIHCEHRDEETLVTEREQRFMNTFREVARKFTDLKIVFEHVSSRMGVDTVVELGKNVAATITGHHLCLTLNNVVGDGTEPHHNCNPIPKGFEDRRALLLAATSGSSKFFLGSDSAPHPREKKECAKGACGVFTAPLLPALLATIFDKEGKLEYLENFTSLFGAQFYGLHRNTGTIVLLEQESKVPEQCGSVVPFMAGQTLPWTLAA